jgi:hypothetical protein
MRKLLLAAALMLALPTASQAQFGLGLRLGYGVPGGDAVKNEKYSDIIKSSVPFQLDAMFRTSRTTAAGLYLGYAVNTMGGTLKASCDVPGVSCSSNTFRAGLQFTGELLDLGLIGLWGGVGTGYEALNFKVEGGGSKAEFQFRGWEWVTISAGADLKLMGLANAGLFVSYGFGQYNVGSIKSNIMGNSAGSLSPDKATHGMFQIGLRCMFNL